MRRLIACVAAMALLSACTPQKEAVVAVSPAVSPAVVTERVVKVAVPNGFHPFMVEFTDVANGYAMFVKSEKQRAEAALFRTSDGGVSWNPVTHPKPVATNQQMYVADAKTVVLLAEPHAWYTTRDGGQSWKEHPYSSDGTPPPDYPMGTDSGRFYMDYGPQYQGPAKIRDRRLPTLDLPVPAGFEHASLANDLNGPRVWLASMKDGLPITTVSRPGGQDFTPLPVPKQPGRSIYHARVAVGHGDVWLLADQDAAGTSSGPTGTARGSVLKGTGLPLVWKLVDHAWVPQTLTGLDEKPNWPYSVAPAGEGTLIVAAPKQTGYFVGGRFHQVPGTPDLDYVQLLADGTLVGRNNSPGVAYLGRGLGANWSWIKVEVVRA